MLARRQEQENLVNDLQTAAATKPLNQDVKGLAPKTPGNNHHQHTKVPLRTTGKGDENLRTGVKQKENNNFVTPIAPRERIPLGAKTTNAKSKAFQTPAPLTAGPGGAQRTQRRSASARKAKLKVHQPEPVEAEPINHGDDEEDDDVPEVEYCPPKITELPDVPDFPHAFAPDETFPQLQGRNFLRGGWSLYCNPVGEDGLSLSEREDKQRQEQVDAYVEQELQKIMEEFRADYDMPSPEDIQNANKRNGPTETKSKEAAAALSVRTLPSYAAPTAAAKARGASSKPSSAPNKTATLASRSTIGYAKGRKVSAGMKQVATANEAEQPPKPKKFWERFQENVKREEELMEELLGQYQNNSEVGEHDMGISWAKDPEELFKDDEPYVFRFQRPGE